MALTEEELAPWRARIANFTREIGRPSYIALQDGWPFGYWFMGNDHSRDADYHDAYPGDYAKRMRALFFDKKRVLHLFSGMVDLASFPGDTLDIKKALRPTWCVDVHRSRGVVPYGDYDLIVADPPYTGEDADYYGTPMIRRQTVFGILAETMARGAHLVWLDQMRLVHSNARWKLECPIAIDCSTNRGIRSAMVYRKL
jgi:hypothetical protein